MLSILSFMVVCKFLCKMLPVKELDDFLFEQTNILLTGAGGDVIAMSKPKFFQKV